MAKSEIAAIDIRSDIFPSLEKTKQEKLFPSGEINAKQKHASKKKRGNVKKKMNKGLEKLTTNEIPSSSRVVYTNNADKVHRSEAGSRKESKSIPDKETLLSFLESNEGEERPKRSIHQNFLDTFDGSIQASPPKSIEWEKYYFQIIIVKPQPLL